MDLSLINAAHKDIIGPPRLTKTHKDSHGHTKTHIESDRIDKKTHIKPDRHTSPYYEVVCM